MSAGDVLIQSLIEIQPAAQKGPGRHSEAYQPACFAGARRPPARRTGSTPRLGPSGADWSRVGQAANDSMNSWPAILGFIGSARLALPRSWTCCAACAFSAPARSTGRM